MTDAVDEALAKLGPVQPFARRLDERAEELLARRERTERLILRLRRYAPGEVPADDPIWRLARGLKRALVRDLHELIASVARGAVEDRGETIRVGARDAARTADDVASAYVERAAEFALYASRLRLWDALVLLRVVEPVSAHDRSVRV